MILKLGTTSPEVARWQSFLKLPPTGIFNNETKTATANFQNRQGLKADGEVGPDTFARAAELGYQVPQATYYPPRPNFSTPTNEQRESLFGRFAWRPRGNGTDIIIEGSWPSENIVKVHVPQLIGVEGFPASGDIFLHRKAAEPFKAFIKDVEKAGLLHLIISWAGSYYPRFIRGSQRSLSNHSWGTAFDINAPQNWLNQQPAADGQKGSLLRLVPIANKHGFYWGGHYRSRLDGMHFELAQIKTNPFAGLVNNSADVPANSLSGDETAIQTPTVPTPQTGVEKPGVNLPVEQPPTQIAEHIINTGDTAAAVPAPENIALEAPPKDGATASATKLVIAGVTVPGVLVPAIQGIKEALAGGFISPAEIGATLLGFIRDNQKYVFILIGLLIVLLIVKKLVKQVTFWISMLTHAVPGWNNVKILPASEPKPAYVAGQWRFAPLAMFREPPRSVTDDSGER